MTEINNSENSRQLTPLHQALKASNATSSKAIAQTSNATAHGAAVNIGAKQASVINYEEIPQETLNLLSSASQYPNSKGIQNLLRATGLNSKRIAEIAAKSVLNSQAA